MRDIRIATVILPASIGQLQANLDRMSHWIEVAKDQGAEIVCFPEMNLSGYAPTAMTTKAALSIPGPVTDRLLQKAHDNDLVILAGLAGRRLNCRTSLVRLDGGVRDPAGTGDRSYAEAKSSNGSRPGCPDDL